MSLCTVNWQLIIPIMAALIASFTAFCISNKWNKQKTMESLAVIAKETIQQLMDFEKIILSFEYFHVETEQEIQRAINDYVIAKKTIETRINFLKLDLQNDARNSLIDLLNEAENLYSELSKFNPEIGPDITFSIKISLFLREKSGLGASLQTAIIALKPISLYKVG